MRTRYTLINMLVNIGGQFFTMLLSFISRMVFIRCLSAAYLGVNGLFTDVLSILNFAELGIGTAMVFSMYEPAARNDEQKLARLMNLYKWMYRAVAASVVCFSPGHFRRRTSRLVSYYALFECMAASEPTS